MLRDSSGDQAGRQQSASSDPVSWWRPWATRWVWPTTAGVWSSPSIQSCWWEARHYSQSLQIPCWAVQPRVWQNLPGRGKGKSVVQELIDVFYSHVMLHFWCILGDIADTCYNFCGLSVFLSVTFVHCAQTAENIDRISFTYDSPMSLPDRVNIWLTSVNPFIPKFSPKVTLLIWSSETFNHKLWLNGYRLCICNDQMERL